MAENISIIDLTEDSFTEEYVSTGNNLRFDPNSVDRLTASSVADQSLIFVGESVRPSRVPFRSVQQARITRNQTPPKRIEPKPKANTAKKLASKPPAEVEPSRPPATTDQPTCPICMETFSEIKASQRTLMTTQCGHIFCSRCLEMVKKPYRSNSTSKPHQKFVVQCPTCRKTQHWSACHPIYL